MSGGTARIRRGHLVALAIGVLLLAIFRLGLHHVLARLPVPASGESVPDVRFTGDPAANERLYSQAQVDSESYAQIGLRAQNDDAVRQADQAQEQIRQTGSEDAR